MADATASSSTTEGKGGEGNNGGSGNQGGNGSSSQAGASIDGMAAELAAVRAELDVKSASLKTLNAELATTRQQLTDANAASGNWKKRFDDASAAAAADTPVLAAIRTELATATESLAKSKSDLDAATKVNVDLKGRLEEEARKATERLSRLRTQTDEYDSMKLDLENMRKQYAELEERGNVDKADSAKIIGELKAEIARMRGVEVTADAVKNLEQKTAMAVANEKDALRQLNEMRAMVDKLAERTTATHAQLTVDDDTRDAGALRNQVKFQNLSLPNATAIKKEVTDLRLMLDAHRTEYNRVGGIKGAVILKDLSTIQDAVDYQPTPPPEQSSNASLTAEQFGLRFRHMDETQVRIFNDDLKLMRTVKKAFAMPPEEKNKVLGNIIVAMEKLTKGLKLSDQANPVVIVCGYQSAGKTLFLGCLLAAHVGYSAIGKATRCPVYYMFTFNAEAVLPRCWVDTDSNGMARAKERPPIMQEEVARRVQAHMEGIKTGTKWGFSGDPLYVQIESAEVEAPGLIIDMPGIQQDPRTGTPEANAEKEYNELVTGLIQSTLNKLDPDYAFAICVEEAQKRREEKYFHTDALAKVLPNRYEVVFTKADMLYTSVEPDANKGEKPWQYKIIKPTSDNYSVIGSIYGDMRTDNTKDFAPIVSLKGVEKLNTEYAAGRVGGVADYKRELRELLKSNYDCMVSAYNDMAGARSFAFSGQAKFDPVKVFNFFAARDLIMGRRNRGLAAACNVLEENIHDFKQMALAHSETLMSRGVDQNCDIGSLLQSGFQQFWRRWTEGGFGNVHIGIPDHDHDYDGPLAIHSQFPLLLKYPIRDIPAIKIAGTMEGILGWHGLELRSASGPSQADMLKDIQTNLEGCVDGHQHKCLNLEAAYQRCVNRFLIRMASICMEVVDIEKMIYASGRAGTGYYYNMDNEKGAAVVVTACLNVFYDQALQYLRDVLREFFYGAVDTILTDTWLVDEESNELYMQDRSFALFRLQLRRGVEAFVDEEIDALRISILSFVSFKDGLRLIDAAKGQEGLEQELVAADKTVPDPSANHATHVENILKSTVRLFSTRDDNPHHAGHHSVADSIKNKHYAQALVRKIFCTMHQASLLNMSRLLEGNFGRLAFRHEGDRGLSNILERFVSTLVLRVDFKAVDAEVLNKRPSATNAAVHLSLPLNPERLKERLTKYYAVTGRAEFYSNTAQLLSDLAAGLI